MWENGQLMVLLMKAMAGWEEAGLKIVSSKRFNNGKKYYRYIFRKPREQVIKKTNETITTCKVFFRL